MNNPKLPLPVHEHSCRRCFRPVIHFTASNQCKEPERTLCSKCVAKYFNKRKISVAFPAVIQ